MQGNTRCLTLLARLLKRRREQRIAVPLGFAAYSFIILTIDRGFASATELECLFVMSDFMMLREQRCGDRICLSSESSLLSSGSTLGPNQRKGY
jgi:hypothetical protein